MERIQALIMVHPFACAVLLVGIVSCWLLWLLLAFAVHEKVKRNEFVSLSRRLLPIGMLIAPVVLLTILFWILFTMPEPTQPQTLEFPRYSSDQLSYIDDHGEAKPLPDGKYALYRKYASGTTVSFGIVMAMPEGFRSYPLDASGTPLVEVQPQDSYSMVAYGVHSLPSFTGMLISYDASEDSWRNFTALTEPYADSVAAPQAFPFLYIDVIDGKGTIKSSNLTRENAGDCLYLYGTWAEPIVSSLVLRGYSREHIAEVITTAYPHAFLNVNISLPVLASGDSG